MGKDRIPKVDPKAAKNALTNAISVTLGNRDTLVLMYDATDDMWIEISRSNK